MLLATAHGEDSEREAEQRDEIEMQICQLETVENREKLELESEDKQQLLNR